MVKKFLVSVTTISVLLTANVMACNAMACNAHKGMKTCNYKKLSSHSITTQVIKAVSKTGLNASQTKRVADGISEYETTMVKIKKMKIFPIDSFINDEFDEKRFIKEMSEKYVATVAAKAALFKYVFSILDKEQKKIFKREYAAPLIREMIRRY